MNATTIWTDTEVIEILTDCQDIDILMNLRADQEQSTGLPVPYRNLGFWEEMRLDQRAAIRRAITI